MKLEYKSISIITLHQPWAQWIALGWKTIETRLHKRFRNLEGKKIGIHVGKKWDNDAIQIASEYMSTTQILKTFHFKNPGGYIICTAYVNFVRECKKEDSQQALIDCGDTKRFGLFLTAITRIDSPIKFGQYKGHQGIWYIRE